MGAARRSGFGALLDRHGARRLWPAGTDADSEVPPGWLRTHLAAARHAWDALVGTVAVHDWSGLSAHGRAGYHRGYTSAWGHPHVHGANFGVHAASYLQVGGVPALAVGEDGRPRPARLSSGLAARRAVCWGGRTTTGPGGTTDGRTSHDRGVRGRRSG